VKLLITGASGVLGSELVLAMARASGADPSEIRSGLASELAPERTRRIVLDSGRAAELGIRLRAPADVLRRVATETL